MTILTPSTIEGFVKTILLKNFDGATETPDFHREMWEYCCNKQQLVAIAAPRQHAKTTAVTVCYGLASLLFRESKYLLIVSDTIAQANGFLSNIKDIILNNENVAELFGLKRDEKGLVKLLRDSVDDMIVELEDGYKFRVVSRGAEQKLRGLNWNSVRPDLIICDDMENDEQVMNKERREKMRDWFTKALLPVKSLNGKVRMVGTILHTDSLLERRMPKVQDRYTDVTPLKTTSRKNIMGWLSVKYRAHSDDYLHLLWPTFWTKDKLILQKESMADSPDSYSQEFLNIPLDPSNALFKRTNFLEISDEMTKLALNYYIAVDLAIDEHSKADYSVFMVAGIDEYRRIHIKNVIRERMDPRTMIDTLITLQRVYQPEVVGIEEMQVSKAIGPFLNEEMMSTGVFLNLYKLKHGGKDKVMRTSSIRARMQCQSVYFDKTADWYVILEEECIKFPRDVHDDCVDCLSYLGMLLDKLVEASTSEELDEEEWLDELRNNRRNDRQHGGNRNRITGY